MNPILTEIIKSDKFNEYLERVKNKKAPISILGLSGVGVEQVVAATEESIKRPVCIITYNELQAKRLTDELKNYVNEVYFFPKREILTYDYVAESKELPYERIEVLKNIQDNKIKILVTSIESILQPIISKDILFKNKITLKVGESYDLEELKRKIAMLGYTKADMADEKGKFTSRGGILDLTFDDKYGVRIEFWGDEIDSIRKFDIQTQRSIEMLQSVEINPLHEYLLETSLEEVCNNILNDINNYTESQKKNIKEDIELIKSGEYISKVDKYFKYFYSKKATLMDYITDKYILCLEEPRKIFTRGKNILEDLEKSEEALIERQRIIPNALENYLKIEDLTDELDNKQKIYLISDDLGDSFESEKYHFRFRTLNYNRSDINKFIEDINKAKTEGKKVYIYVNSKEKAKKLQEILNTHEIISEYKENLKYSEISNGIAVKIMVGNLNQGYESYEAKILVIVANELISIEKRKRRKASKLFNESEKIIFSELKPGDYVVHRIYGIGQFVGVNTIVTDSVTKDYIKIKYKNDDMLYVPTDQLDNVKKYIGGGESLPKINRLGSKEWENTKAKVKKNLREVARELIELYAKRQKSKGFAFSKDTPWQQEFENSFMYQETDDQLRCIYEIKKDMEMQKPMDRLLCGDVGYGKTEVAMRAAFKAVMDQKQVAYLVPTTILADQQYKTFKERMKDFPVNIEVLNRFRTKKQQQEIIKKLKLGEIDIVIGTHRLLSKDVEFKDLGFLIIDEEHRFGVKDKEKIKEYKNSIDVLTMTATPIPRTLHMSIVGIRDMSIIYEPPQNRKPVQTYVLEYDEEVIREAITKELERGGQVFYLFNNVEGIERKANEILGLVPEAKVAYAHGKMSGNELENIMLDFINGETNVLVCTTILESGIDIPNANTIIVENADRLGLAQLYQIRGRVGRSDVQAYAYITYKRDKMLSEVADKRLKAMKEFTEFGSGFKIAMRDLEIRGAGSLLGEIQSGHLEQVGYDTYCDLLDQVVKEMKGIEVKPEVDIQIDLDITSYIPDNYIEDSSEKIDIYQKIALCRTENDIQDVIDEITDRFGDMPKELNNLIEIARIKQLCKKVGVMKITEKNNRITYSQNIVFYFDKDQYNPDIIAILLKKYGTKIKFSTGIEPYITLLLKNKNEEELIKEIKEFLKTVDIKKVSENTK